MRRASTLLYHGVFTTEGASSSHRFSLQQIQEGFETLVHKPSGFIKGVVYPNP